MLLEHSYENLMKLIDVYNVLSIYYKLSYVENEIYVYQEIEHWEILFEVRVDRNQNKAWINHQEVTYFTLIDIIQEYENCSRKEADETLSKITGINISSYLNQINIK